MRSDFVVTDSHGASRAFIEVKSRSGASPEWATELRRNLVDDAFARSQDYFVIVTPKALYVWNPGAGVADFPREFPIRRALEKYVRGTDLDVTNLSPSSFELIVQAWLADLVRGRASEDVPADLAAAVEDGRLLIESESSR
jgi:hypothetical protein